MVPVGQPQPLLLAYGRYFKYIFSPLQEELRLKHKREYDMLIEETAQRAYGGVSSCQVPRPDSGTAIRVSTCLRCGHVMFVVVYVLFVFAKPLLVFDVNERENLRSAWFVSLYGCYPVTKEMHASSRTTLTGVSFVSPRCVLRAGFAQARVHA